ncbi:MAG: hypothetical protein R3176_00335, partial [Woeseiaceae bacterium]|nr:hypothetical protein [Woeseiaceae bacterium]
MANDTHDSWITLRNLLETGAPAGEVEAMLDTLQAGELLQAVFHLAEDQQRLLLGMISAERAADIVEELPDSHAANLMERMSVDAAVPIVEEMASDDRVDLLGGMPDEDAAAILEQLDEEDADEIRHLSAFDPDTAGGMMMTEYAAFPMKATIRDVIRDLTSRDGEYEYLTVH